MPTISWKEGWLPQRALCGHHWAMLYWAWLAHWLFGALSHKHGATATNRTKACIDSAQGEFAPGQGKCAKARVHQQPQTGSPATWCSQLGWPCHLPPLSRSTHSPHVSTSSSGTSSQQELFSTQCHRAKKEEIQKNTESPCFFNTDLIKMTIRKKSHAK